MDQSVTPEDLVALGEKLDQLDEQLTERERAVLLLVFELAGEQVEVEDAEVDGFELNWPKPPSGQVDLDLGILGLPTAGQPLQLGQAGFLGRFVHRFAPVGPNRPGANPG